MKFNNFKTINLKTCAVVLLCGLTLAGCHSDNDSQPEPPTPPAPEPGPEFSYRLTVINLTNNQPMSPVAFALHNPGFNPWQIGTAASEELEKLAEGGDGTDFLSDDGIVASMSGDGILMPGMSQTLELTVSSVDNMMFSAATMLVNTNDAFTGLKQQDISELALGDSLNIVATVYDSGTELNTESAGTMPGPADMGEGYNVAKDDVGFVAMHSGVVSSDDGLTMSVLNQSHRFEAKVARFTIERIK